MRFLVLQHVDVEHPGIFRDFMRAEDIAWDTVELDRDDRLPAADDYAALIVMGGPMDVWEEDLHPWLATEKAFIRQWITALDRPFLGVCLGHQPMAAALGGRVAPAATGEVRILPVALTSDGRGHPFLAGVPDEFECLQWHGAEVAEASPGGVVLARSDACAVQALACGRRAFGFQFHVEVIETTVDDWAAIPAYAEGLRRHLGADGAARFRASTAARLDAFNRLARTVWDNWRRAAFAG
jgi:GMP synthase-like glutamine amidotransferase